LTPKSAHPVKDSLIASRAFPNSIIYACQWRALRDDCTSAG